MYPSLHLDLCVCVCVCVSVCVCVLMPKCWRKLGQLYYPMCHLCIWCGQLHVLWPQCIYNLLLLQFLHVCVITCASIANISISPYGYGKLCRVHVCNIYTPLVVSTFVKGLMAYMYIHTRTYLCRYGTCVIACVWFSVAAFIHTLLLPAHQVHPTSSLKEMFPN